MARVKEDCRCLTGSQKASIPLLSLGQDQTAKLLNMMENEEIKEVSQIMSGRAAKMLKEDMEALGPVRWSPSPRNSPTRARLPWPKAKKTAN